MIQNRYVLCCGLFASIGGLTFGYDQGVIANLLVMEDFQRQFPASPLQQGALTAVLELGALSGALISGAFSDSVSRGRSIGIACAVFCIGSTLQTVSGTLGQLSLGRLIGGVGIGSLSMLCPLYMSEISPPETRGSLLSIEQFSIVLGVVFGFWIGFFTRNISGSWSWRLPLAVQIIPGLLLAAGSFLLPASPRFLVSRNQINEAQLEAALIADQNGAPGTKRGSIWGRWALLFTEQYKTQTWIGILVMFFQQWTGINAVLYYAPFMMRSMGVRGDTVMLISSGFVSIMQFLSVIPAIIYIDRLGRRPLLMGGAIIMAFSHASIAALVWYGQGDWAAHRNIAWSAVSMIYLFTAGYGGSFGPVAWVLPNEIFPLTIRSQGVGLSTASNWCNNFLVGLITPSLISVSPAATYMLFSCGCVAAFFWSKYLVPETRGRSLEEMDTLFESAVGQEIAQRKQQVGHRS
ncbi:hypothetical protein BS47DRAFT_1372035 [Hydnum rufescens UP504]|uniref:Major facilitator superfamily (MFS) profile domain-containing protein n=1 Tax=Hydnum rufescens UP504 TaxID=1448309 RepID=A0A9P6DXY3_9AGAM|nr:hypothetical protein BS47DRAFT_1372035 [Hydnum rufescens UP504]